MHAEVVTHETPVRPHAPYAGIGCPEPVVGEILHVPSVLEMTRVLMALDVARYPTAVQVEGLAHDAPSRAPYCDPRLGLGVTDQLPPASVTISGNTVVESPLSVFPTATQSVGDVYETLFKKLSPHTGAQ